jgi:NAD(P)-dependent dehydrogenase (short-subunit alcohol dehydrogenase family)
MMNKLIVVTGASRGIGAAIAHRLAEVGYFVGCISRSGTLPKVANVPDEVRARWIPIVANVDSEEEIRAAFAELGRRGPAIAGLVNNAGLHMEAPSATMSLPHWNQVMSTNATSVVIGCQQAFPHLKSAGGGLIVNIGSFFDKLGVKRNLAYCASKAAIGAVTRVLSVEWAVEKIAVVNVAPGFILTDLNREQWEQGPLRPYLEQRIPGRLPGQPQDVAGLVVALFMMKTPFLTGETIYIDGAQSLVA